MQKLINWLKWLDNNLIKLVVVGLIFIIPLYPKFPLKTLEYTYIAIRLDDLIVVVATVLFFIQLIRKKVTLNRQFFILFLLFWTAIVLSFIWGAFIQHSIIRINLGLLHTLRRFEYMIVFFIAAASVNSKKDLQRYLYLITFALVLVCLYGIGQKFFGLPAVQTMNPEFAKGELLYLTPEARVSSTFAGHYDLAAYLVLLIPIMLGLFISKKNVMFFLVFILSLFVLVLTASRSSFGAYVVFALAFLIYNKKFKTLISVIIITAILFSFSTNLTSRFFKVFQVKQIFVNEKTGEVVVPQKITTKELPAGDSYIAINKNAQQASASDQQKSQSILHQKILQNIREEEAKSGKKLTSSEEAKLVATLSAGLKPVNTVVSDISFSTRLKVEWPRAIAAFLRNPLLGSGAFSITESTDGDYFRWLGEFGLLGTLLFLFILYQIGSSIFMKSRKMSPAQKIIFNSFVFGLGGLFLNASYIDVFEASKVAYYVWLLSGLYIASLNYQKNK